MDIPVNQLLWRTKGKKWEYRFVLTPKNVPTDKWWAFYQELSRKAPNTQPVSQTQGQFRVNNRNYLFYSTIFDDNEHLDEQNRNTLQTLVWFPDPEVTEVLPDDWGIQVVRQLNNQLLSHPHLVSLSDEDKNEWPESICASIISEKRITLSISGKPGTPKGPIDIKKKNKPDTRPPTNPWLVPIALRLIILVSLVILGVYGARLIRKTTRPIQKPKQEVPTINASPPSSQQSDLLPQSTEKKPF